MEPTGPAGRPSLTLGEAAMRTGGLVIGDPHTSFRGIAPLVDAEPDELGLVAAVRYVEHVAASRAGGLLVERSLAHRVQADARPRLVVQDAHAALIPLLEHLHPAEAPRPAVHPTAVLGRGVQLGKSVTVGPYAVLEEDVRLGDRVRIGAHSVVGRGVAIGDDSILYPQVTLYPGTVLGARVILHSGVRVGVDGFGYAFLDGGHRKVPQVGRCVLEDDVELGANTCIDRGSIGATVIGRGTKLDNLVHIAHNVRMGPHCAAAAQVGLAGSTTVDAGVLFAGQSGVGNHAHVGRGAKVGARAAVLDDIPAGETVLGLPARKSSEVLKATLLTYKLPELMKRVRELEKVVDALTGGGAPSE